MRGRGFGGSVNGTRPSIRGLVPFAGIGATLPLLFVLAVSLEAAPGEIALSDHCSTAWCANDRDNATMRAQSRAIITEQLDARKDCTRRPHLADTVLTVKARGRVGDGVAVVTEMAFDKAWTSARAGDVWVLAWCG